MNPRNFAVLCVLSLPGVAASISRFLPFQVDLPVAPAVPVILLAFLCAVAFFWWARDAVVWVVSKVQRKEPEQGGLLVAGAMVVAISILMSTVYLKQVLPTLFNQGHPPMPIWWSPE